MAHETRRRPEQHVGFLADPQQQLRLSHAGLAEDNYWLRDRRDFGIGNPLRFAPRINKSQRALNEVLHENLNARFPAFLPSALT